MFKFKTRFSIRGRKLIKKLKMGDRKARTYIFSFDIIEIQAIKPFWFIFYNSFQIYFIICSLLSSNLYYNMGGPKNVGSCINKTNKKIRKIQNNKYLTNKCKKIYIFIFLSIFSTFFLFFSNNPFFCTLFVYSVHNVL